MRSEVESLAERLRFLCCVNVQGLDPRDIRPFSKSAGRDGWLTVARTLMEGRDEKVDAITAEVAALRETLAFVRDEVEWETSQRDMETLARINNLLG